MDSCNNCQNITFDPLDECSADEFAAIVHPNLASLKRRAESRECHFCVALYHIMMHQKTAISKDDTTSISLVIQYKTEIEDDWDFYFIDKEIGLNDGDAPDSLSVQHSDVQNTHFRIHNPMAISRSSLRLEQESSLADEIELTNPTLGAVCRDTSTGSDASMALMRSWITMCEESHQSCGKKTLEPPSTYPTRLLDVSSVDSHVGLVLLVLSAETNFDIDRPSYATLSHRWKPGHTCSTFSSNEREYARNGIPTGLFTKTFREACITVKNLGLRYLWIDSLCILQDSIDDKAREVPKMADYYQNADFNIAASTERDGEGSLWQERDGEAMRPFNLPITLNTPSFPRKTRKLILRVSPVLQAARSHLDSRGWILQERIFPRRTLFFDPYWVSFECAEMSASESCPQGIRKDLNTKSVRLEAALATVVSREFGLSTMGGLLRVRHGEVLSGKLLDEEARDDVYKIWFAVISEYCDRDLTHNSDRLDAISALAGRLSQILRDDYIAGIWKSNLLKCLWWDVKTHASCDFARVTECGAPTWSWASMCNKDLLQDAGGQRLSFAPPLPIKQLVQILDLSWTLLGSNKHGNISGAKLTVSGNLLRGYAYHGEEAEDRCMNLVTITDVLKSRPAKKQNPNLYKRNGGWLLRLCAKTLGQRHTVILPLQPDTYDALVEGFVYLLPLAESIGPIDFDDGGIVPDVPGGRVFGLLLKEVGDGIFERVGCAEFNEGFLMATEDRVIVIK